MCKRKIKSNITVMLVLIVVLTGPAWSLTPYPTIQLTDNSYDDEEQQVSGNNVVWRGHDGSDYEIYLYDGNTTTQLTNNSYNDFYPQVSGDNVVWRGHDGGGYEIYLYDGSTTIQLTDNSYADYSPQVSGDNVVWYGHDGSDYEIYLYDGSTTIQLTNNSYIDFYPQVSGDNVVWRGHDGSDDEIYLYDGVTTTQLTNNSYGDFYPQVSGDNVVWYGHDGSDYEIYLYDGVTATQLTNNSYDDVYPQVSGDNVVWYGHDGGDNEIYLYDGVTTTQLTNNSYDDVHPQVSGDNVVWYGWDGSDAEIYLYDGDTTYQLTDNSYNENRPQISGDNVVWKGNDGSDYEIYFCNLVTIGYFHGTKWHDNNANFVKDIDEQGLSGWNIYADLNNNGQFDSNEPNAITDSNGDYEIVIFGDHDYVVIAEEQKSCWEQTSPGGDGTYTISFEPGELVGNINFGNALLYEIHTSAFQQDKQDKLLPSDGAFADFFGFSVSTSGDVAIVGAYNDDDNGTDSGSAYIFTPNDINCDEWDQLAKLTASDGAAGDWFGFSVSISSGHAIVGAHSDDDNGSGSGSAYIFKRDGMGWSEQAKLTADDAAAGDYFGNSVSINGDYAIVGARDADTNGSDSGSAYIFKRDGTSWSQQAKLTANDGSADDHFGHSVSINGDYAIVGSFLDDDNGDDSGSAYIFKRDGTSWRQQAKLTATDGAADNWFGWSVSISVDYAIVGANHDDDNGDNSGSAYIFKRDGTSWSQQAKLLASDGFAGDGFGDSVSISGDYAIVGAINDDDNGTDSGSAYIFKRGETWNQQVKLTASDGALGDWFGDSVSISSGYAIVGSSGDNDNGSNSGSVYIFSKPLCPISDQTGDCFVNFEDLAVMCNEWLLGPQ